MILRDKDKEIIRYIEKYNFITIAQAYDLWFFHRRYGYDSARKRLNQMVESGYLNQQYDMEELYAPKIYYIGDKYRKPSKHMITIMDVYAYITKLGAEIIYFKREESWLEGKYVSDGFIVFKFEAYCFSAFIEVLKSNQVKDMCKNSKFYMKYTEIIESDDSQKKLQSITGLDIQFANPKLIIVDDMIHKNKFEVEGLDIIKVNSKLDGLSMIFI